MDAPEAPRFTTQVRVRYADTDAAGVAYYANYLVFFEVARVELLRALGCPITEVEARGFHLPVIEAHVRYRRPARLDDLLDVTLVKGRVGPASFDFDYEVTRDAELVTTGWTRLACVDAGSGRAVALPDWLLELFERIPASAGAAR
ncbi:MAG: acyl-CoA thioesterase [Actinomycetota bacterium]|nr:MAG: acyl-CoA thioesterase [Actinomycetota bacterium]